MLTKERIDLAYPLVRIEALRVRDLPAGITADDLESVGGEALIEASANFDPTSGSKWLPFARLWLRNAMRSFVGKARIRARRHRPLDILSADGQTATPRPDPRAEDPADRACGREQVRLMTRDVAAAQKTAPKPGEVAAKVDALRAALFAGVEVGDATQIMRVVSTLAKSGDLRAAKLFIDLLGLRPAQQQAVFINTADV